MNHYLSIASQQGNIDALYSLIRRDAYVLHKIDVLPFAETPLHVAASLGKTSFAMEIMALQPSFARKLDEDGCTPLHLAVQNERTQVVLRLLDVDESLVRVPARDGLTPLHCVAQRGNLYLLAKFLEVCPRSIEDVTNKRESVLHITLKCNNIDAFKLLLGWLQRAWLKNASFWEKKLLNWQDDEGNTLLHLATAENLPEIARLFLDLKAGFGYKIDINALNLGGQTVFDIAQGQEIMDMLHRARFFRTWLFPRVPPPTNYFRSPVSIDEKFSIFFLRQRTNMSNTSRVVMMVVAVLFFTVTFQAMVNPLGGVSGVGPNGIAPLPDMGTSTTSQHTFIVVGALNLISLFATLFAILLLLPCDHKSGMINLPFHLLFLYFIAAILIIAPRAPFLPKWMTSSSVNYFIFCIFFALLILLLQFLVNYRQRKLVNAFHPDGKLSHQTLT